MRFKKLMAGLLTATMALGVLGGSLMMSPESVNAASFTDLDQDEIVAAMGAGWNLGNQLEASIGGVPYETAWGNPTITENLIKAVKSAGFSTIRVPVSYLSKIGSDYTIDSSWLDRVQEVVDMCIDNDMYVIINIHGDGYHSVDGGWLLCDSSDQTTIRAKYQACWKQIATRFKDYDEHLIFESMNEEFDGTYGTPNTTYYSNINELNQIFVDTVRQTGGNNDKRWLMVPGWNTNIEYTAGNYGFEIPSDNYLSSSVASGEKRIMISVHYYDPWAFCGEESTTTTQWGSSATDSSKVASYGDESFLSSQFYKLYSAFTSKGYPVVIGEYGAIDKSAYDSANKACRIEWTEKLCTYAKQYGCVPVWWDNGYTGTYGFALFDRNTCTVAQQSIIDAIIGVMGTGNTSSSDTLEGTYYIKSYFSGMYLDVVNGSSDNNANIQQWYYNGYDAQKFKLVSAGDGYYYMYTGASGYEKVVDVAGRSTADGANVLQYTYKGTDNQKFKLVEVSDGVYAILTGVTSGNSCLDVYGWSTEAGGNIAQWTYWGGACQLWYLEPAN